MNYCSYTNSKDTACELSCKVWEIDTSMLTHGTWWLSVKWINHSVVAHIFREGEEPYKSLVFMHQYN